MDTITIIELPGRSGLVLRLEGSSRQQAAHHDLAHFLFFCLMGLEYSRRQMVGRSSQLSSEKVLAAPQRKHAPSGGHVHMRASILQRIFRRVQISRSEGIVLDAILSKANLFGKHARVAYECIAGITGFSVRHVMRLVKSLIFERRLLRVDKRRLWYCHNAINVYHVVIPWRREVSFSEMGSGRAYLRQDRLNNKGDMRCHPNTYTERERLLQPARLCTEEEASRWFTTGSAPWYFAQGLTPPWENGEKGSHEG